MSANPNTHATDNPLDRGDGPVWYRLHSEREDICEVLCKEPALGSGTEATPAETSNEEMARTLNWHKELLHSRLQKIDDALDRLMGGEYGHCSKCDRWIEDTKLDFDPAIAFCIECWQRKQSQNGTRNLISDKRQPEIATSNLLNGLTESGPLLDGVSLETLTPLDTIWVRTLNSVYRILLLEPKSGRALVEGGHFVEPVESIVNGSTFGDLIPKVGWIGTGWRLEMWVNDSLASTSPVQSFRVEHHAVADSASMFACVGH